MGHEVSYRMGREDYQGNTDSLSGRRGTVCVSITRKDFFIWQTLSDDGRFGMNLAKELNDAKIPYELHIFEGGVHGLGLADGENDLGMDVPHITHWGTLCDEWMQMHELK